MPTIGIANGCADVSRLVAKLTSGLSTTYPFSGATDGQSERCPERQRLPTKTKRNDPSYLQT
jgi:hypothetical protein